MRLKDTYSSCSTPTADESLLLPVTPATTVRVSANNDDRISIAD